MADIKPEETNMGPGGTDTGICRDYYGAGVWGLEGQMLDLEGLIRGLEMANMGPGETNGPFS